MFENIFMIDYRPKMTNLRTQFPAIRVKTFNRISSNAGITWITGRSIAIIAIILSNLGNGFLIQLSSIIQYLKSPLFSSPTPCIRFLRLPLVTLTFGFSSQKSLMKFVNSRICILNSSILLPEKLNCLFTIDWPLEKTFKWRFFLSKFVQYFSPKILDSPLDEWFYFASQDFRLMLIYCFIVFIWQDDKMVSKIITFFIFKWPLEWFFLTCQFMAHLHLIVYSFINCLIQKLM